MTKILVTTYMFPSIMLVIPYAMVMAKLNLTNTRIGLMLVYLSFSVPYAVWMLVGFFKTVPIGIEEAARIDGANKLQVFIRIVLPLVSPGIVATAIYVFINAWNEYLYSMILMSSSDKTTISVAVKTLEGADILNWGSLMAACAIVVVPSIIFFCFIQNKMAGACPTALSSKNNTSIKGVLQYETVGYAIVGTGYFGAELGRIMKTKEGAKIVAVYDPKTALPLPPNLAATMSPVWKASAPVRMWTPLSWQPPTICTRNRCWKLPATTRTFSARSPLPFLMQTAMRWSTPARKIMWSLWLVTS